jgi:hypothetical protein
MKTQVIEIVHDREKKMIGETVKNLTCGLYLKPLAVDARGVVANSRAVGSIENLSWSTISQGGGMVKRNPTTSASMCPEPT